MNKSYFIAFILVLLFISCAPELSYSVKKFFFDGVPDPFKKATIDSLALVKNDSLKINTSLITKPEFIVHKPYLDRKCNDCHDPKSMGKLSIPLKDLCFKCHTNFNEVYTSIHGPVASGNCTQCHSPHRSKYDALLHEEGNDLCFKCHEEKQVKANVIHKTIGEKNCTTCHNPHGGDNNFYINKNSCFECHDNFENKFPNLHGPVSAGLCSACHENHTSKEPHLLKSKGKELCFNCHLPKDVYANKAHKATEKQNCTSCHNPHGSQELYLLTKNNTP